MTQLKPISTPNPVDINPQSVLALLPMAGRATRLGQQPASKEVLLVRDQNGGQERPLASFLFAHLADAGIQRGLIITRSEKTDIESTFGLGSRYHMQLRYRHLETSSSTPFTLAAALIDNDQQLCALGFPDILFRPCRAYTTLLHHLNTRPRCDVVLGMFPTKQAAQVDMVEFDEVDPTHPHPSGRVLRLVIKSKEPNDLRYTWSIALWRPQFSQYLRKWVDRHEREQRNTVREHYVGDVIQAAIRDGFDVEAVRVSSLPALDAGTPATLADARRGDW